MQALNFNRYAFRLKNSENKTAIFDLVRKKFVLITPEEWVRQHVLHFLISDKKYPLSLLNVEKVISVHGLKKRYDVVVYQTNGSIAILVECKAPGVAITQTTFDQIARYNSSLNANYLMVTNGLEHFFCQMDYQNKKYVFLQDLPSFETK